MMSRLSRWVKERNGATASMLNLFLRLCSFRAAPLLIKCDNARIFILIETILGGRSFAAHIEDKALSLLVRLCNYDQHLEQLFKVPVRAPRAQVPSPDIGVLLGNVGHPRFHRQRAWR